MLNSIIGQVARKLSIPTELAVLIYRSYWGFIKDRISNTPLQDMSEEDFESTAVNYNIPYIGKLHTNYEKIQKYNRKLNYYNQYVRNKKNSTHV